jgi:hypothetical protein
MGVKDLFGTAEARRLLRREWAVEARSTSEVLATVAARVGDADAPDDEPLFLLAAG